MDQVRCQGFTCPLVLLYDVTPMTTSCHVISGIEPRGNVVLKPAEFLVETVEAGLGEVLVYVEDPEGHTEEVGALRPPVESMLTDE